MTQGRVLIFIGLFLGAICVPVLHAQEAVPAPAAPAEVRAETQGQQYQENIAKIKRDLKTEQGLATNTVSSSLSDWKAVESEDQNMVFKMLKGLALCLGIFFVGVAVLKRINPKAAVVHNERIKLCSRLAITPKTQVFLVEVDGQRVLLSVGQEQMALQNLGEQTVSAGKTVALALDSKEPQC